MIENARTVYKSFSRPVH